MNLDFLFWIMVEFLCLDLVQDPNINTCRILLLLLSCNNLTKKKKKFIRREWDEEDVNNHNNWMILNRNNPVDYKLSALIDRYHTRFDIRKIPNMCFLRWMKIQRKPCCIGCVRDPFLELRLGSQILGSWRISVDVDYSKFIIEPHHLTTPWWNDGRRTSEFRFSKRFEHTWFNINPRLLITLNQ